MRLGLGIYKNFASFRELEFDFSNKGLTLIAGPTGSGKSTLLDAPSWCLFGVTSKGGSVDEIKSWNTSDLTLGIQKVDDITVYRTRGQGKNDLYWTEADSDEQKRGKDLIDTQKLINQRLGVTDTLYFLAAYFHQFSTASSFFTAKAKDRREAFEELADLTLPDQIVTGAREVKKVQKKILEDLFKQESLLLGKIESSEDQLQHTRRSIISWKATIDLEIKTIEEQMASLEQDKLKNIERLNKEINSIKESLNNIDYDKLIKINKQKQAELIKAAKCKECGGNLKAEGLQALQTELYELTVESGKQRAIRNKLDSLKSEQKQALQTENTHSRHLERLTTQSNPHLSSEKRLLSGIKQAKEELSDIKVKIQETSTYLSQVTQVSDLAASLRGILLENTVLRMETSTNDLLSKYFDAELRVIYTLEEDKVHTSLHKNGNECSFTQLSGGQRALLKLCFGVSVMQAAENKSGVHFEEIFMDESLNGMDDSLKIKAFRLFQDLSLNHTSVYVIEHSEPFKSLFDTTYNVTLTDNRSSIEKS